LLIYLFFLVTSCVFIFKIKAHYCCEFGYFIFSFVVFCVIQEKDRYSFNYMKYLSKKIMIIACFFFHAYNYLIFFYFEWLKKRNERVFCVGFLFFLQLCYFVFLVFCISITYDMYIWKWWLMYKKGKFWMYDFYLFA